MEVDRSIEKIVSNIKELSKQKGIPQKEMAAFLGVKQNTYSQWLSQRREEFEYVKLQKIAEYLKEDVVYIITYPDRYVLEPTNQSKSKQVSCSECKEKDKTIQNLNELIDILKNKTNK